MHGILVLFFVCVIWYGYEVIFSAFAIQPSVYIDIDERKNYASLLKQLTYRAHIKMFIFNLLSSIVKYSKNIKNGRYELTSHTNYLQALRMFLKGNQRPIRPILNNIRFKKELVQCIGSQLCLDQKELMDHLNNPIVTHSLGFNTSTILVMFIPNTYEVY